jgi:hypothetical protein
MARDALQWARQRAAATALEDLPARIGGHLRRDAQGRYLRLPYFAWAVEIRPGGIRRVDGTHLTRWEQVLLFNHLAQGGSAPPTGRWKGFHEFPNTVSKVKSMRAQVEEPLRERFEGHRAELLAAAASVGGTSCPDAFPACDLALCFQALPRVPLALLFWDSEPADDFGAEVKLLFDETVTGHLDIESILFLSERLRQLLCGEEE